MSERVSTESPSQPHQPADDELTALAQQPLTVHGRLAGASNHTLLVQVGEAEQQRLAVYKPRSGERPLWDFPHGTLCDREVAAYVVSEALGWGLVPSTVRRDDAPHGPGAVQRFVDHDPERHYFALIDEGGYERALAQMAVFDVLVNNADRKASHVMATAEGGVLGIDHGLTFHPQPKLRTVIWDMAGHDVAEAWRRDLASLAEQLARDSDARELLSGLLADGELAALAQRAAALAELTALPDLPPRQRPYPWPPL